MSWLVLMLAWLCLSLLTAFATAAFIRAGAATEGTTAPVRSPSSRTHRVDGVRA